MNAGDLKSALGGFIPIELAEGLVDEFLELRRDVVTSTLGRSSAGKFIEAFVQALQFREKGAYEAKPAVDEYLRGAESRAPALPEDLRVCACRVARSIYTLRNKRAIAHLGVVDPNVFDLRFTYAGAQWLLAEMIRQSSSLSMAECGRAVSEVQVPVHVLVEVAAGERVVHGVMSTQDEALVVLHSVYPEALSRVELTSALRRRHRSTVGKALERLWSGKKILGDRGGPFRLSHAGYQAALAVINRLAGASGA